MAKNKPYLPKKFGSIKEMMDMAAAEVPEKLAYRYKTADDEIVNVTYSSFYNRTQNLGAALTELGYGDAHIACVAENSYSWIVAYLTVMQSAGVFVPVDKDLPTAEMLYILNNSDASAVFFDAKHEEWFIEHRAEMPNIKLFINLDGKSDDGEFVSLSGLVERGKILDKTAYKELKSNDGDMKLLVYTSGTTGVAKGVMLTEHNLVASVYYGLCTSSISEVGLSVLPYNHTYAAVCEILVGIHYHTTLCLNDNLKNIRKNMQLFKPEYMYVVPAHAEAFYNNVKKTIEKQGKTKTFEKGVKLSNALRKIGIDRRRDLFKDVHAAFGGNLRRFVCGGAPIRPEMVQFFDAIGINLSCGYGITECSPLVSVNTEAENNAFTVGHKLPCLDWRIDNPSEEGIGEICVKGDVVMKGYYKAPDKTAEAIIDGWFYTGDYGKLTKDDTLMITGRKKNIIILGNGKNIYPEEIEGYIQNIDYVEEVVVRGIKSDKGTETGLLAEIYSPEQKTAEEVISDVKRALSPLPSYKHISKIVMRTEPFEKTTTRKIKR